MVSTDDKSYDDAASFDGFVNEDGVAVGSGGSRMRTKEAK